MMTTKQLNDFKKKFEDQKGDINDVGLLLCELFQSVSTHLKDIKTKDAEISNNTELIFEEIIDIRNALNPVYTIIQTDD